MKLGHLCAAAVLTCGVAGCATATGGDSNDLQDTRIDASAPPIDAAPDADTTPDAAPQLGARIAYWSSKVNLHVNLATNAWEHDPDCSSGATADPLTYCKKWYPTTTAITSIAVTPKAGDIWAEATCNAYWPGDGLQEWLCIP
jgi:hypothetical protein